MKKPSDIRINFFGGLSKVFLAGMIGVWGLLSLAYVVVIGAAIIFVLLHLGSIWGFLEGVLK
jgi:hypothetical protein